MDTRFWSVSFLQSGNIWFTKDRQKYSKAKKGSQCPRAKAIVAAGIVQEEGKKKRKQHHSVEKKWLRVQKSPQGISKMKPETPRQEDNTGSHGLKLTKSPVLDITVTRQLKKDNPRIKSCRWALAPLQEFKTKRVLWTELETACGCLAQASKASGAALSLAHLQPFAYLMFNWISAAETEKVTWTCIQEHH